MRLKSHAAAIALSVVMAGCGGGGGGESLAPADPPPTPIPVVPGVASFPGSRGDYSIARVATGNYTVTDRRTNGASNVVGTSAIQFSDMTINLIIGDKATALGIVKVRSLIELYIAFLKQVPDADSLVSWIDRLQGGLTMAQAADELYAQAIRTELVSGYGEQMTNDLFVTAVYKGVFGATAPSPAEVQAWSSRIDKVGIVNGISRGALVLEMLAAARSGNVPALATATQLLDNKIAVGQYFAVQQGINYNSAEESVSRRVAIAAAVTPTDISAATGLIGFADVSFNLMSGK